MSPAGRTHGPAHSELVVSYALRAVPPAEKSAAEAQIAACPDCTKELATLRPILAAFRAWPSDLIPPSDSSWERLAQRIAGESKSGAPSATTPEWIEPGWIEAAPGISVQILATDPATHRISLLVRLAPGTDYPPHEHGDVEEVHLLDGELLVDAKVLHPGDYVKAAAGSTDRRVRTRTGCICVLVTSSKDRLI
jgi:quercetin dioxygenase-like cupin family protein